MNSLIRWLIGWPEPVVRHLLTQEECDATQAEQK